MRGQQPFMYEAGHSNGSFHFDPRAATRASFEPRPAPRSKPTGPLVSFNQHPDSWLILPTSNANVNILNPKVKEWIKLSRALQLILRCFELLLAAALLTMMILLSNVDNVPKYILCIVPGVAMLHCIYGIYHLSRKSSGRSPGSSASYMLFAAFFDTVFIPFYAYGAYMTRSPSEPSWSTILSDKSLTPNLVDVEFVAALVSVGFFFLSLIISVYLCIMFRKIDALPPDYNPLEAKFATKHKKTDSLVSEMTVFNEKRLSRPLEEKRSSGQLYQDLSRAPTVPFFHTRTNTADSQSTFKTFETARTAVSQSPRDRDSHGDLASRNYQVQPTEYKRSSLRDNSPSVSPTRYSDTYTRYSASPTRKSIDMPLVQRDLDDPAWHPIPAVPEAWFKAESPKPVTPPRSPRRSQHQPRHQKKDSTASSTSVFEDADMPNPLATNPPDPKKTAVFPPPTVFPPPSPSTPTSPRSSFFRRDSQDITDRPSQLQERDLVPNKMEPSFKAKLYGDLRPNTPPVMIGSNRDVSSGTGADLGSRGNRRRDASGKLVEEGRGSGNWGVRMRKASGVAGY